MKNFKNRIAVVTGGASGLGKAMALRFANEGMQVMLADIEENALNVTMREFTDKGYSVSGIVCDVSQADDVEELAHQTTKIFGAVHILCNNAGVSETGRVWEHTTKEWEWGLGVNVWGVIHGIRVFTPIMLKQNVEAHIVNTASVAGLLSLPSMGLYCVTKHAVVTITECLHHDLLAESAHVRCSVLCPAYVPTKISESDRNRPIHLKDDRVKSDETIKLEKQLKYAVASGKISADQVANLVFEAIQKEQFYILPHPRIKPAVETRVRDILEDRNPTNTF